MGGGDAHGHHGIHVPKVPDWRIYKVEDCEKLVTVQRALAQKGLKDPWLRNEVWRYQITDKIRKNYVSGFFRGWQLGVGAFIVTIVAEKLWEQAHPSQDHHGH